MSYDLFVWCDPPAADADAAFELIDAVCESEDGTSLKTSPQLTAFLEELFREHPPLEAVDADKTVWSFTADRSDRHALLSMQAAAAQRVAERMLALCAKYGLRCFDPQTGELFQPDAPPSQSARTGGPSAIIGSTSTPTDLFWFVFTKFRNDRDISGHFLGRSAAALAEVLQSGAGADDVRDLATLLYVASCDDVDLDSTVSEEIHDHTAVVTVVPNENTSIRRHVHMRRIGRAWKIYFPSGGGS